MEDIRAFAAVTIPSSSGREPNLYPSGWPAPLSREGRPHQRHSCQGAS
jgi:hypothetical protein